MKRVAIIGVGLMGGSLGLALKRRGLAEVHIYARREETRRLAMSMGAADAVFDSPGAALRNSDMAVFCLPICSIPEVARDCVADFEPGCVVTDVGSTKAVIAESMREVFRDTKSIFVGSHPMAGSEKTGMESARADLYQGAITAITPLLETPETAIQSVVRLWNGVGAKVVTVDAGVHDTLVARTSHLPHLIAALLVSTSGREGSAAQKAFCGPGFRDSTRIAAGSPEVWHDIVKTNHAAILAELKLYDTTLKDLIGLVEREDFEGVRLILQKAKDLRHDLLD